MGTKKGMRRKTARRAYEPSKNRSNTRTVKGKKYTMFQTGRSHLLSNDKASAMSQAKELRGLFSGLSFRVLKGVGGKYNVFSRKK